MGSKTGTINFDNDDSYEPLPDSLPYSYRRTPIVVTLADPEIAVVDLQKMLEAGMNIVKLNLAEFTKAERKRLIGKIDKAAQGCTVKSRLNNWPVSICLEIKGTMVRTGLLANTNDIIRIKTKDIILTNDMKYCHKCCETIIFVDNPNISKEFVVGTEITIGDASLILQSIEIIDDKSVKCKVIKGGILHDFAHVSARREQVTKNCMSKIDYDVVKFALQQEMQMIIIKYTRGAEIVKQVKDCLRKLSPTARPLIFANICSADALDRIEEILEESDGITVSRDMLPYELPPERRFRYSMIEKWLIAKSLKAGKPIFISGGIFLDALRHGNLRINEVSDVTNLILTGATGLMLKHCHNQDIVLNVLRYLNDLCMYLEPTTNSKSIFWSLMNERKSPVNAAIACIQSCVIAAHYSNACVIIIPTVTGKTVTLLMQLRPAAIVITVSSRRKVANMLRNCRGIQPLYYKEPKKKHGFEATMEKRIQFAEEFAVKQRWLKLGDLFVTLQRGTETSSYCDTVKTRITYVANKSVLECDDDISIKTGSSY